MIYSSKTKNLFWFWTCHCKMNVLRSSSDVSFCHYFITAFLNDRYLMGTSKDKAPITLFFLCLWRPRWSPEPFQRAAARLSAFLFLVFVCRLVSARSATPFVSITSLGKQRFGGPTCRSPGAGHCSPRASQDYPQRRRQLRLGEGAINLHKLQLATLPPLSLDTQIIHLLLNSPQSISWFPTTEQFPCSQGHDSRCNHSWQCWRAGLLKFVSWFCCSENVFLTLGFSGLGNIWAHLYRWNKHFLMSLHVYVYMKFC